MWWGGTSDDMNFIGIHCVARRRVPPKIEKIQDPSRNSPLWWLCYELPRGLAERPESHLADRCGLGNLTWVPSLLSLYGGIVEFARAIRDIPIYLSEHATRHGSFVSIYKLDSQFFLTLQQQLLSIIQSLYGTLCLVKLLMRYIWYWNRPT